MALTIRSGDQQRGNTFQGLELLDVFSIDMANGAMNGHLFVKGAYNGVPQAMCLQTGQIVTLQAQTPVVPHQAFLDIDPD